MLKDASQGLTSVRLCRYVQLLVSSVEGVEEELVPLIVLKWWVVKAHARHVRTFVQHCQVGQQVTILRQHCTHVAGNARLRVREVVPVSTVLQVK